MGGGTRSFGAKRSADAPQDDIVTFAGASPLHPALQVQTQLFDFFVHFDISFFRVEVCQQPDKLISLLFALAAERGNQPSIPLFPTLSTKIKQ